MGFQNINATPGGAPVIGYGDEFPTVSVPQGMLFIRTDQSRAYIRESGAWKEMLDVDPSGDVTLAGNLIMSGAALTPGRLTTLTNAGIGSKIVSTVLITDTNLEFDGLGEIRIADKLITSAEVLVLNATPIEVVAAPGVGITLQFLGAHVFLDFNSVAYPAAGGEDLVFRYSGASGKVISKAVDSTMLDNGTDSLIFVGAVGTDPQGAIEISNAPIVAHILSGEIGTGDSPIKIRLYYRHVRTASLEAIN